MLYYIDTDEYKIAATRPQSARKQDSESKALMSYGLQIQRYKKTALADLLFIQRWITSTFEIICEIADYLRHCRLFAWLQIICAIAGYLHDCRLFARLQIWDLVLLRFRGFLDDLWMICIIVQLRIICTLADHLLHCNNYSLAACIRHGGCSHDSSRLNHRSTMMMQMMMKLSTMTPYYFLIKKDFCDLFLENLALPCLDQEFSISFLVVSLVIMM